MPLFNKTLFSLMFHQLELFVYPNTYCNKTIFHLCNLTLSESSNILLSNVNELNLSSNKAATSLEETAAALEEITSNIRNNTENIAKMARYSNEVTQSSAHGENLANQTTQWMK